MSISPQCYVMALRTGSNDVGFLNIVLKNDFSFKLFVFRILKSVILLKYICYVLLVISGYQLFVIPLKLGLID